MLLHPRGGCQEALLVISNQINAKTGHELPIGSAEGRQPGAQATVVDLRCDVLGWISVHLVTESIEPVFQKGLGCRTPFMAIKCCFDMNQRNPQIVTDLGDSDRIWIVLGEIMMNCQNDLIPLVGIQWLRVMVDVEQCSLLLLLLSAASLMAERCNLTRSPLSTGLRNQSTSHLEPFCYEACRPEETACSRRAPTMTCLSSCRHQATAVR